MQKSATLQRLQSLHTERSAGMGQVINFFERVRTALYCSVLYCTVPCSTVLCMGPCGWLPHRFAFFLHVVALLVRNGWHVTLSASTP